MIVAPKANPKKWRRRIIWLLAGFLIVFVALAYPLTLDMKCYGDRDYWGNKVKPSMLHSIGECGYRGRGYVDKIRAFYTGNDRYDHWTGSEF